MGADGVHLWHLQFVLIGEDFLNHSYLFVNIVTPMEWFYTHPPKRKKIT